MKILGFNISVSKDQKSETILQRSISPGLQAWLRGDKADNTGSVLSNAYEQVPGDTPAAGQTPLPSDLEQACIEQAAAWFLRRDMLGLDTSWPKGGILQRFSKLDLLLSVQQVLNRHRRWSVYQEVIGRDWFQVAA